MKKIIFVFVLATTLFSCSLDDSSSSTNTNLLQRVDFYPGTSFESRWNFNSDGLLITITDANGNLVEKFFYDSNNNVIQDIKYSLGSPTENYLITYDLNNKITSINDRSYNYNASENRYYYTEGNETFSCELNAEGLATHYSYFVDFPDEGDDVVTDYFFGYENGNLIAMYGIGSSLGDIEVHFIYGTVVNPLKNATLSVLKVKSLIEPNIFYDGTFSNNVKEAQSYSTLDPETHSFGMLFYPSNKLELITQENYSSGVFETSLTNSYYYYQGDVIP
jgi:hypothetical protein